LEFNDVVELPSNCSEEEEQIELQLEKAWSILSDGIFFYNPIDVTKTDIITDFLPWIIQRKGVSHRCNVLGRFIEANRWDIMSLNQYSLPDTTVFKELDARLNTCIMNMSPEEQCIYKAYQQRWIWNRKNGAKRCNCKCIVADNIDHLHPQVQIELVKGLSFVSDILHSKTLVTVRPVTFAYTFAGHYLREHYDHCSPMILNVLKRKVERFVEQCQLNDVQRKFGKDLVSFMVSELRRYKKQDHEGLFALLVNGTCGMSIRYAIRNIHNFLESEDAILAMSRNQSPFSLKPSALAHGYFCSSSSVLSDRCFARLDSSLKGRGWAASLVKPRILDYLTRGTTKTKRRAVDIINFIQSFGYEAEEIVDALNDLMSTNRPLVWCRSGFRVNDKTKNSRIVITPIGLGYLDNLFGELSYEQILLEKRIDDGVLPSMVLDSHYELTKKALDELELFLAERGHSAFYQIYEDGDDGITLRHWKNLKKGLQRRNVKGYDWNRDNFISETIRKKVESWSLSM
jgi:hypothetical protein